jgi:hypothetical protein
VLPLWLTWARELQAIAQTGLTFSKDEYDRERYQAVRSLAARIIMAAHSDIEIEQVEALFAGQAVMRLQRWTCGARFFGMMAVCCWCAKQPTRGVDTPRRLGRCE